MTRFPHSPAATRISDCPRRLALRCLWCRRRWPWGRCDDFAAHLPGCRR